MARGRKPAVVAAKKTELEILKVEEVQDIESEESEKLDDGYSGIRIRLDVSYTLTSDKYQYILNKNGIDRKTGKDNITPISYHASLEQVINSIAGLELRTRTAKSYSELLKNSNDIKSEINAIWKELDDVPNKFSQLKI